MKTFFLHDGSNEQGPFTLDELKTQKLTRSTPLRLYNTDAWLPAEKIDGLRPLLVPQKIKRVKDVVPVMMNRLEDLRQRKPRMLYGGLLLAALLFGLSIYSSKIRGALPAPAAATNVVVPPRSAPIITTPKPKLPIVAAPAATVSAAVNAAPADAAKQVRQQWRKLISVTNSNYGIGLLGGIKDLSVIVNNRTNYVLDEVEATVTYIKASGGVWKTKQVKFTGVPSHETKEVSLPDVSRGKKVKVVIHKLVSKAMGLHYTDGG